MQDGKKELKYKVVLHSNMGKLSLVRVMGCGPGFLEGTIDNR